MRFTELQGGEEFFSDKFSDRGNLIKFEKIGDQPIEKHGYLPGVWNKITYWGNVKRKTDGRLFIFSLDDEVFPV